MDNKIKIIGKYIGPRKIVNVADVKRKTYLGRGIVRIEFDDETTKEYPIQDLEIIVSKEAKDFSTLRQLEVAPVAKRILGVLADSELPIFDPSGANIQYLLQTVLPDSIRENTQNAYSKLFDKSYFGISLADIDRILQNGKEKDKKVDN